MIRIPLALSMLLLFLAASPAALDDESTASHPAITLIYPTGLALDPHANLFISDTGSHRILKLDPRTGQLTPIAGTGHPGLSGDGAPATSAQLHSPTDLAFDSEGNLLIADTFNHRIRRIDKAGIITTLIAEGLNNPQSIALDLHGNLFIADTYNHVVKRMDRRTGAVTIVAGTEAGLAGDKGPAIKAQLNLPQAVAISPDGSIYISDAANSRIRRVSPDGTIDTIAGFGPGSGDGGAGFAGDGGPPQRARLFSPADLEFNPLGQLFISDTGNNRIRMIAYGAILTIAGNGKPGLAGDHARATQAMLNTPQKLALAPDGSIYIADRVNRRVRRLDPHGIITTVAGGGPSPGALIDPSILPPDPPKSQK